VEHAIRTQICSFLVRVNARSTAIRPFTIRIYLIMNAQAAATRSVRALGLGRVTHSKARPTSTLHRPSRPHHVARPAAFDDDVAASAASEAASAASDVAASLPAPDDPVISAMFTLAVVALSVLTLGVAYLSISSFLDQRQEEEDRKKAGYGPSKTDGVSQRQGASTSTSFDESAFQPAPGTSKKRRKAPKKKSDKGFGN
jgi:hypothetical protein